MTDMTTNQNPTAADRADRDLAAIEALGIVTKDETGNTETFFPHGTEMIASGKEFAARQRAEFLGLPTVGEAMATLEQRVQREGRADRWADVGDIMVTMSGHVAAGLDLETRSEIPFLTPTQTGWQRLASFAPSGVPTGLRTNVNAWTHTRKGDKVRLRTRDSETLYGPDGQPLGEPHRELFAVVSPGYVPYDLDAIAADVAANMPSDCRARVKYDRERARIDVLMQNPHYFPDSTGTASVGEAHRMMLRIRTADDGTGGFRLGWSAQRIRCVNCTLLRGSKAVLNARHNREDLVKVIQDALAAQGDVMEGFAGAWRSAWQGFYLDGHKRGDSIDGLDALRRMVFHGVVKIPGMRKDGVWEAVRAAWEAEPGDSVAHVHMALTRAAHAPLASERWTPSEWASDEVEEQAATQLYQTVHVLADIPKDKREELGWN